MKAYAWKRHTDSRHSIDTEHFRVSIELVEGRWLVTCHQMGINHYIRKTKSVEKAKSLALEVCKIRLERYTQALNQLFFVNEV